MEKILIVDDDRDIARLLSDAFEDEGFDTVVKNNGETALLYVIENPEEADIIILDIMMPGISGLEVCREIRNKVKCPIIFVSAKSKSGDAVSGLEIGADDYISKPFVVEELVARVKAHLRREKRKTDSVSEKISVGEIEIDTNSFTVYKNGTAVPFSTREFQLLQYLMENAGKVLTREQIFSHVWNTEFGDIGTVAVNIKNIRDKIDSDNEYIKTIWGVGYKFVRTK